VAFLRSGSATDRATALWVLDVADGTEQLVADPLAVLSGTDEQLTPEERSRRERMREGGAGITAFSTDESGRRATFALSSRLFVVELVDGPDVRELPAAGPVVDPRISPDGSLVAYVADGGVHVVGVDGTGGRPLATPDGEAVTYGLADFCAAEELGRFRGFWWAPDSASLLVARVDESTVQVWHIADPEHPERAPQEHRYPAAGTPNAVVTLHHVRLDGSASVTVPWDGADLPYLVDVSWTPDRPPLIELLTRRQDRAVVLTFDPETADTEQVAVRRDEAWVDAVPGAPAWTAAGALVTVDVVEDRYALLVDGVAVSPEALQVRRLQVDGDQVLAHVTDEVGSTHVARWTAIDGWQPVTTGDGVCSAVVDGGVTVLATSALDAPTTTYVVMTSDGRTLPVRSLAADPVLRPAPRLVRVGARRLPTAVLLPTGWAPEDGPLPVLLDPYGGPHHAEVVTAARSYLESQWWADQGFAVVVVDGRGTPGKPSWERAVRLDLATGVLDDQVEALQALAAAEPGIFDTSRVAMRGWSFGGYLAALAVLRRPDVFHAAVAGAPVTDFHLYDTAYTERYLGLPDEHPEAYEVGSLLPLAADLARPLLVIHGLSDDNVVAAHSLRLSSALLAAGRPHTFLPLSGVTHMTPQEVVAENLLLLQLEFLQAALGLG
jgi:dipeptidyl-peptidase-4